MAIVDRSSRDAGDGGGAQPFAISAPSLALPKGGGAIRGIGEKFAANPVSGTGSLTVPIAVSPGRAGFTPQLSLSYDSAAGNGPFGFGWSLALPAITRKTDNGLPRYRDAEASDVFMLSGAEDLVPVFRQDADGAFVETGGRFEIHEDPRTVDHQQYAVRRYRPRVEGLFARIERWTNVARPADCFWRSISRDNVTTWYGRTARSRIADPDDPSRIFSWLISESHDATGNVVAYDYKEEDDAGVDAARASERHRVRTANRYVKHVRYGNHAPYFPKLRADEAWPAPPAEQWYFEVVFDYGEHDPHAPLPDDDRRTAWPPRADPFSSYRSSFEVRTYRLCQRVLMFHHFDGVEKVGEHCLVRSTDFTYSSERDPADARNPVYSFLRSVSQVGYARDDAAGAAVPYRSRALPPLEFEYTLPEIDPTVRDVDAESLDNLPSGIDGNRYQWVDLEGDGLAGVLTEQGDGWFYKRNVSPLNVGKDERDRERTWAALAPVEAVPVTPNASLGPGGAQFMDLAGDGRPDLVVLDGPSPGFYEHDGAGGWTTFRAFTDCLNRDSRDPNVRLVDLDGDGHADVLITEDDALVWHPSLAERGFGPAECVAKTRDEEDGPALVFADGTQSVFLADMSGDGLADLVRIRNGEVSYWPSLGYGRFGAKVAMDNAPWFDEPDLFDQSRVLVADVDGTGTTDIVYLHRDGARLYFNQSGNGWSRPTTLASFPPADGSSAVAAIDLLGTGTACLVWSSALPTESRRPMRYLDLMGGQKPHLLVEMRNNLGGTTRIDYAPSTKFYLQDKAAGRPWITRLPFPVHVVERVSVTDAWRGATFTTGYSYHHGYFDGAEREFRGFGRVEQLDVTRFGTSDDTGSPYVTDDRTLYQPPVQTVSWFHTGAFVDREHLLSLFAAEYFPHGFPRFEPGGAGAFRENDLPEPDLGAPDLTPEEWREALRACKGMLLRQEAYELDLDALDRGEYRPVRLFSTAYHNCHVRRLQPTGGNRHAVFLATESEAITYHYELDLTSATATADPRVQHTLTLNVDALGNVLQSIAVAYPRRGRHRDAALPVGAETLIASVQGALHVSYTELRFTNDVLDDDDHRLRVPCETLTYELTGFSPGGPAGQFTLAELRAFRLSPEHQRSGTAVAELQYHQQPDRSVPPRKEMRLVEHRRTLFFKDDESPIARALDFRRLGRLGLKYEDYKLALSDALIDAVFGSKLADPTPAGPTARELLRDSAVSGYVPDTARGAAWSGNYWLRSGIPGFASDAADHFYLPERYVDPFGATTRLEFDRRDLFVESSTDERGNVTEVVDFDYRVLAPRALRDINGNVTRCTFDLIGMPTAIAISGGGDEIVPDDLVDLPPAEVAGFFAQPAYSDALPRRWLAKATARFVYHFGETTDAGGAVTAWAVRPAGGCSILREAHVNQPGGADPEIRVAIEYTDGAGAVFVKKVQAEPDPADLSPTPALRWIATGKTVLNNKAKPIKQYEPYFSGTAHRFDAQEAAHDGGAHATFYYDAPGRLIRTEHPDGTLGRVEFSPWHVTTFDANDAVLDSRWYAERNPVDYRAALPVDGIGRLLVTEEQRAAWLAARDAGTPAQSLLDSLGRVVVSVAHIRVPDANADPAYTHGGVTYRDEKRVTFTRLDIEGRPLWIRDARGNLAVQCVSVPRAAGDASDEMLPDAVAAYDIAGNQLFQAEADAGERWVLGDASGQPLLVWDLYDAGAPGAVAVSRQYFTRYDRLHRATERWLTIDRGTPRRIELIEYRDAADGDAAAAANKLMGQPLRRFDESGLVEIVRRDFKGNTLETRRRLNNQPTLDAIDWRGDLEALLELESFTDIGEVDALNRVTTRYEWHRGVGSPVAVYETRYNQRGLLSTLGVRIGATKTPTGADVIGSTLARAIVEVQYNEKGQKVQQRFGNDTLTEWEYDRQSFRLLQLFTTRPAQPRDPADRHSQLQDARVVQDISYTYDPVGNVCAVEDQAFAPVFFQNRMIEARSRFEYDCEYRLIRATGRENGARTGAPNVPDGPADLVLFPVTDPNALRTYSQTLQYDAVGNVLRLRHEAGAGTWVRRFRYADDGNRLVASWDTDDDWQVVDAVDVTRYAQDRHGNLLNFGPAIARFDARWDHRDMIAGLDLGGGGTASYQYDAEKQRTRKRVDNQRNQGGYWERISLGSYELYRRFSSAGGRLEEIETHHVVNDSQRVLLVDDVRVPSGAANPRPDGVRVAGQTLFRYQYGNQLGSACVELDDRRRVIACEEYHPYGTTAYQLMGRDIEAPPRRYRFAGMERDEESGLDYVGARYCATHLCRWLSCDPRRHRPALSPYEFCSGNPVSRRDADGQADELMCRPSNLFYDFDHYQPQSRFPRLANKAGNLGFVMADENRRKGATEFINLPAKLAPISLQSAYEAGDSAFVDAVGQMLGGRRFGEVTELQALWNRASANETSSYDTSQRNFRDLIANDQSPEAKIVRKAFERAGVEIVPNKGSYRFHLNADPYTKPHGSAKVAVEHDPSQSIEVLPITPMDPRESKEELLITASSEPVTEVFPMTEPDPSASILTHPATADPTPYTESKPITPPNPLDLAVFMVKLYFVLNYFPELLEKPAPRADPVAYPMGDMGPIHDPYGLVLGPVGGPMPIGGGTVFEVPVMPGGPVLEPVLVP